MEKCINCLSISTHTLWRIRTICAERIFFRTSTKEHFSSFGATFRTSLRISFTIRTSFFKSIAYKLRSICTFGQPCFTVAVSWLYIIFCKSIFKTHTLNHVFNKVISCKSLCQKLWWRSTSCTFCVIWIFCAESSFSKFFLPRINKHICCG